MSDTDTEMTLADRLALAINCVIDETEWEHLKSVLILVKGINQEFGKDGVFLFYDPSNSIVVPYERD